MQHALLPLVQKYMIDSDASYIQKYQEKLKLIFEGMMKFRDTDGLFFWALDTKGFADNSLITASCSIDFSKGILFLMQECFAGRRSRRHKHF